VVAGVAEAVVTGVVLGVAAGAEAVAAGVALGLVEGAALGAVVAAGVALEAALEFFIRRAARPVGTGEASVDALEDAAVAAGEAPPFAACPVVFGVATGFVSGAVAVWALVAGT